MKWTYVPVMFALAFIYTKISFSDLAFKKASVGLLASANGRTPASGQKTNVSALKRVPASVLYKNLNDDSFLDVFKKISEFRGTIVGNPYVESFGFVVDDKSKATFTVRDFSDVSVGAYLHDVLGHLVSAKLIEKKVSWISYFEAYKNGLQDQPHIYSYYVEKGLEDAAWVTQRVFEDNVSSDFPFEFTQLKSTHTRLDSVKKGYVQEALKKKFSKIQFYDLFESNSGIKNYQVLVRIRPQDKIQWMELSESSLCDYDLSFNQEKKSTPFENRFSILKDHIFDGKLNHALDSITIDKKSYVLKFSDHFAVRLMLKDIPADDYHDIILDEAYTLGKIHRRSLGANTDDYIKTWALIPGAVIDEKMVELKYKLKDLEE